MRAGFGGGCHWCTEAVFQSLRGVRKVEQGFIASDPPHGAWSEAVIVHFSPREIGLDILVAVHLRTHAATSDHAFRGKYRSAVYTFDASQSKAVKAILRAEAVHFDEPIVTQVLAFRNFKPSDARFRNYYKTRPGLPFCTTHIDPKLDDIRTRFARYAMSGW